LVGVLLHRLEVIELFKNVVCYLCTGHEVGIMAIFVILVAVNKLLDARLVILL
tara:strand:- start:752 stop:910 length:159 start_codon:yes stop_codon:yes gene_type:complete